MGPFPRALGARSPYLRTPLLAPPSLEFFAVSPPHLKHKILPWDSHPPRSPYANTIFVSHYTRYAPQDFFAPIYPNYNISFYSGTPTSNVTPIPTQKSDFPPRDTYATIFFCLSTSILTKGFTQALHTSNVIPTPTTPSDPPPRVTHSTTFSHISTTIYAILLNVFTQALPTSNVTTTPTPYSDSPPRVTYPAIFSRLSTSILTNLTKSFTQALPNSTVTPTLNGLPYTGVSNLWPAHPTWPHTLTAHTTAAHSKI